MVGNLVHCHRKCGSKGWVLQDTTGLKACRRLVIPGAEGERKELEEPHKERQEQNSEQPQVGLTEKARNRGGPVLGLPLV